MIRYKISLQRCPRCASRTIAAAGLVRCTQSGCMFAEPDCKPPKPRAPKPLSKDQRAIVAEMERWDRENRRQTDLAAAARPKALKPVVGIPTHCKGRWRAPRAKRTKSP